MRRKQGRTGWEMRETWLGEMRGARLGEGGASVKQGALSPFKAGFSHYNSATGYCILQRPYYKVLLAFMMAFTSQVQHLHGKTEKGYVAWTPATLQR